MKHSIRHLLTLCATLIALCCTQWVFADDTIKEETTPPAAEGALPATQTPPIMDIGKRLPAPAATADDKS